MTTEIIVLLIITKQESLHPIEAKLYAEDILFFKFCSCCSDLFNTYIFFNINCTETLPILINDKAGPPLGGTRTYYLQTNVSKERPTVQ